MSVRTRTSHAARTSVRAACAFVLTIAACAGPASVADPVGRTTERPALIAFEVEPASATVTIDDLQQVELGDDPRPVPVLPGEHRLVVFADGYLDVRLDVDARPGDALVVRVTLWPALEAIDAR